MHNWTIGSYLAIAKENQSIAGEDTILYIRKSPTANPRIYPQFGPQCITIQLCQTCVVYISLFCTGDMKVSASATVVGRIIVELDWHHRCMATH